MSNLNRPNYLQNGGYQLIIPTFRDINFFTHTWTLPTIVLPTTLAENPFSRIRLAGDKAEFDPVSFSFYVDEDLKNYELIYNWFKGIGYITEFKDYTNYPNKGDTEQTLGEQDITVIILNSKNNPSKAFRFHNAIPVQLGGWEMTSQDPSVSYLSAQVTFEYDYFEILNPDQI